MKLPTRAPLIDTIRGRVCTATLLAVALSGCITTPSPSVPAASDIAASVRALYSAAGVNVPTQAGSDPRIIDVSVFAQVGYNLVDAQCSQYFDAITEAHSGLKMTASDITAAGAAAAVISTLARASARQIGITAAVFGFGGVAVNNIEQYAFATPYPTQTRTLVLKALTAYRQASPPASAKTLPEAMDDVAGYANLCTFAGIASLSEQAIAAGTPVNVSSTQSLFTSDERTSYLAPIDVLLSLPSGVEPTDTDYAILAAISDPALDATKIPPLLSKLSSGVSGAVSTEVFDAATQAPKPIVRSLWKLFAALMTANSGFAAQVGGYETGAVVTRPPKPAARPLIAIPR